MLLINVKAGAAIRMVSGTMFNKPVHFYSNSKGNYTALVGIDMDTKPDRYKVTLLIENKEGKKTRKSYRIRVKPANFGTQELTLPPDKVTLDEETLKKVEIEKEKIGKLWDIFTEDHLWDGNFIPPVAGEMSGDFGLRRVINGEQRSPHTGVDVDANEGASVQASNNGWIVFTEGQFFNGKTLVIDHGLGSSQCTSTSRRFWLQGEIVKGECCKGRQDRQGNRSTPSLGSKTQWRKVNPASLLNLSINKWTRLALF